MRPYLSLKELTGCEMGCVWQQPDHPTIIVWGERIGLPGHNGWVDGYFVAKTSATPKITADEIRKWQAQNGCLPSTKGFHSWIVKNHLGSYIVTVNRE